VTKNGRLWTANTVAGGSIPGHGTAYEAVAYLRKKDHYFWTFEQFGPQFGTTELGGIHHKFRPIGRGDKDEVFAFCLEGRCRPKILGPNPAQILFECRDMRKLFVDDEQLANAYDKAAGWNIQRVQCLSEL